MVSLHQGLHHGFNDVLGQLSSQVDALQKGAASLRQVRSSPTNLEIFLCIFQNQNAGNDIETTANKTRFEQKGAAGASLEMGIGTSLEKSSGSCVARSPHECAFATTVFGLVLKKSAPGASSNLALFATALVSVQRAR